ncbi:1-phosphofructokinase [Paramicrobacterium humi]|uniref:1-phosphofructokinase n=1 Tax=Paramicrobacterium humi TaxID=640635 RepID=A0A1H4IVK8_9MICO|nr:PfkB family carbohydrate kinase [Microbacterium humi]SEB38027.1 1-phosphofructokinase [Microbacterium humi]
MIITVTPNPALDATITLDHVTPGGTHRVAPAVLRAGGKGINVARVLAEQGEQVTAIAPVSASEVAFADDLASVPHSFVGTPERVRRSTAFVETGTGTTTIFNESGTPQPQTVWIELGDVVSSRLPEARCLVVSGSCPPEAPASLTASLTALARNAGIPSIADATGEQLLGAARAGASVLKPNRAELADTTGENDPVAGARALQALGAGTVVVSLGEDGMIAVPRDPDAAVLSGRLGRVLRGNPTGAGDAAVAALAACLARDPNAALEPLLRRAVAWSAAAVLMPLAGSIHSSHPDLAAEVAVEPLESR